MVKTGDDNYICSLTTAEFWHRYMILPLRWAALGDNALYFIFPKFSLLNEVLAFFTEFILLGRKQSRLYNTAFQDT